jgi:hypothetical protein
MASAERPDFLLSALVMAAGYMAHGAAAPKSPLIVNVRDKGAKGEGRKFADDAMPGWSGYALRSEPAKKQ